MFSLIRFSFIVIAVLYIPSITYSQTTKCSGPPVFHLCDPGFEKNSTRDGTPLANPPFSYAPLTFSVVNYPGYYVEMNRCLGGPEHL